MAVISNIEWKCQEAVLNALGSNSDLSALGVQLRRAYDASVPVNPPSVTVYCNEARHPQDWGGRTAVDECFVELVCQTKVREDLDGALVAQILGACRDQVRDSEFYDQLDAVVNFKAYGAEEVGTSVTLDDSADRIRKMTIRVLCNPTDLTN